jgi:glycosyltransferase involved in cell wall biosynthesis
MRFLINIPFILYIFNKKFKNTDLISFSSNPYPPLGIMANILCYVKNYKKTLFVIDADFINDLELKFNLEKKIIKRIALKFLKNFYLFIFNFCINNSMLTFVIGDKLFERYGKKDNVFKIYASWIKYQDIITLNELTEKIENKKLNKINICFIGTLKHTKNPITTIETIKILKKRKIPIKLDIIGNGPLKSELIKIVKTYNLSDQINFKEYVPYGEKFYNNLRKYDIIIIPNLSGEQPRIIFDAWANGVVIIGSKIKSFSIIINYLNGILCDPTKPICFANAIEKLYFNKTIIKKLVFKGRKQVEENTIESIYNKRMKIIKNYI